MAQDISVISVLTYKYIYIVIVPEETLRVIGIKSTLAMFKKPRTKVVVCTTSPTQAQREV